jgi:hypothetical protein
MVPVEREEPGLALGLPTGAGFASGAATVLPSVPGLVVVVVVVVVVVDAVSGGVGGGGTAPG